MEVFCPFGGNEGNILPGCFSLNGSVFFDDVPVLYPVVPRLGMAGEVNDDFIFVVFIDGLLGKQGLTIQIVEVVVFLVDIEAFTVKHFIMNVLIMVREAVSYTLDVFFCASDDVVKEIFSHPKLHIDEHHAGIEVAGGMHALGIGLFSAIRYDGDSISLKVQFGQILQGTTAEHIPIQVQDAVSNWCDGRCDEKAVEESSYPIREKEWLEAAVVDQVYFKRAVHGSRCFLKIRLFFFRKMIDKEMVADGKVFIVLMHSESYDPHVWDIVGCACKSDVESIFCGRLSEVQCLCYGVVKYI